MKSRMGRLDGLVNVGGVAPGDLGPDLARVRLIGIKSLAARGVDPFVVDKELVAFHGLGLAKSHSEIDAKSRKVLK